MLFAYLWSANSSFEKRLGVPLAAFPQLLGGFGCFRFFSTDAINLRRAHYYCFCCLLSGQISGQRLHWEQNGVINGKKSSLQALGHGKVKPGMYHLVVTVSAILLY